MGVSTDGILTYGLAFSDGDGALNLERLCGHLNDNFKHLRVLEPGDLEYIADKLLAEQGLELIIHCSSDYPMHIITLRNSYVRAYRGHAERIHELPAPTASQEQCLKDLQAILGGELGVWLCSYWG